MQTQTAKNANPASAGACTTEVVVPVFESASETLDRNITDIQTAIDGGFEMDVLNDNGGFAAMAWHHKEFAGKTLLSAQFSCFLPGFIFTNSKFIRYLEIYSPIIN
ncbi:hypothetical protein ACLB2K_058959 [Fragaria x ananassa]